MPITESLFEGVIVMFVTIAIATVLKRFNVLKKDDSLLLSKIVIKITLPALIFYSLANTVFNPEYLIMAASMAAIELCMMMIAWAVAKVLNFDKGKTGALILVSAFGMTSMLGYPLIQQIFPHSKIAIEEAVITSEFGVGFLLFILGPFIAMYYGDSEIKRGDIFKFAKQFFTSPIFIALVLGIVFSFIGISRGNPIYRTALHVFKYAGNANFLMVTFTVGLILEFKQIKTAYVFIIIALFLKLFLKPVLAILITSHDSFTPMMSQIILIETALPSAILSAVFAKQYNCRPDLVSMAIMATLVVSLISISLLFVAFF